MFAWGLAVAHLLGVANPAWSQRTVLMRSPEATLLILPFNLAVEMPAQLGDASDVIQEELEKYLRARGKHLKTVSLVDAKRLWLSSIREVRDRADSGFDEAAALLAQKLSEHAEFDAVIAPSLVVRNAHVLGGAALWDGVERALEIEEADGVATRAGADAPFAGTVPAASLHVVVLKKTGEKVQESVGGLELLVRVRVQRGAGSSPGEATFELVPRRNPMTNPVHLREGIAVALTPFVPPR